MRSIDRQYYRIIFVKLVTRSRTIKLACYCRYATHSLRAAIAVSKCLARHGYAGVVGYLVLTRQVASGCKLLNSWEYNCGHFSK